jgi:3-deoxy-D-arabino-heptulosonate 7-phosphate (DAHP) synthase
MVEVHPDPDRALSDGAQSLSFANFKETIDDIKRAGLLNLPDSAAVPVFNI